MHDQDLDDLAMIAAYGRRLVARSQANGDTLVASSLAQICATSMTALSSMCGATAEQVQARLAERVSAVRAEPQGAVH